MEDSLYLEYINYLNYVNTIESVVNDTVVLPEVSEEEYREGE